jgi:predicted house-cleaning noncanonical NTP pyrophosphatase (MazG superfamily)
MTTKALKEKLIKSVESVENNTLLESLLNMIELESDVDSIYEFTDQQLMQIEDAKKEIKEGRIYTDNEVNKEIDEWLNK